MPVESNLKPIRLLLIENNPADEQMLRQRLLEAGGIRFEIEATDRLDGGLERVRTGRFDLVLLDLPTARFRGHRDHRATS
jgi:CheY-like chemotaxis protein